MGWVAFDLETAKLIPPGGDLRGLGITVVAFAWQASDGAIKTAALHGALGKPMNQAEASHIVRRLQNAERSGHTVVGWNSTAFDYQVLADESGLRDECAMLALRSTDMMLEVVCRTGAPASLDRVAKGMGLAGKTEGISGRDAPRLWAQGECDKVLEYAQQDVRTTLEIALAAVERGGLTWTDRYGKPQRMALEAWLPCCKALRLPVPATVRKGMERDTFTAWMERIEA